MTQRVIAEQIFVGFNEKRRAIAIHNYGYSSAIEVFRAERPNQPSSREKWTIGQKTSSPRHRTTAWNRITAFVEFLFRGLKMSVNIRKLAHMQSGLMAHSVLLLRTSESIMYFSNQIYYNDDVQNKKTRFENILMVTSALHPGLVQLCSTGQASAKLDVYSLMKMLHALWHSEHENPHQCKFWFSLHPPKGSIRSSEDFFKCSSLQGSYYRSLECLLRSRKIVELCKRASGLLFVENAGNSVIVVVIDVGVGVVERFGHGANNLYTSWPSLHCSNLHEHAGKL